MSSKLPHKSIATALFFHFYEWTKKKKKKEKDQKRVHVFYELFPTNEMSKQHSQKSVSTFLHM